MGARKSIINLKPLASFCSERRRLVYSVGIAVLVVAAGSVTLQAQNDWPPDFPASVNAVIPTPQYLPAGYELWRIYKDPDDGFRTGKTETEVQYRDPGCWDRRMKCSLQVFVSPMTDNPFWGTTGRTPESLSLRIGNRTVEAKYFNTLEPDSTLGGRTLLEGSEARLETGKFNALVFPMDDFMIGIRADSQARLGRAELVKVAESFTYTAR